MTGGAASSAGLWLGQLWLLIAIVGALAGMFRWWHAQHRQAQTERDERLQRSLGHMETALAQRLSALEVATRSKDERLAQLERDLLLHKAELPLHYVRREDHIRGQSTIEAKLDSLAARMGMTAAREPRP